jgi:hypothetical protein
VQVSFTAVDFHATIWLLQALLAVFFLAVGSMKAFNYNKLKTQAGGDAPGKELTAFIGASEMTGALGLVFRAARSYRPGVMGDCSSGLRPPQDAAAARSPGRLVHPGLRVWVSD